MNPRSTFVNERRVLRLCASAVALWLFAVAASAHPGVAYEYSFQRTRSTAPTTAYGSIVAGRQVLLADQRGKVILLVDSTMATSRRSPTKAPRPCRARPLD